MHWRRGRAGVGRGRQKGWGCWQGTFSVRKEESAGNEAHPASDCYKGTSSNTGSEGFAVFFFPAASTIVTIGLMD